MNIIMLIFLIITTCILVSLSIIGIRYKSVTGAGSFSLLMMAMAVHSGAYGVELMCRNTGQMFMMIRIEYLGIAFFPFLIMLLTREYTGENKIANKYVLKIIFTINCLTLFFVQTNPVFKLFYSRLSMDTSLGFPVFAFEKGIWYYMDAGILDLVILYSLLTLMFKIFTSQGDYRKRVVLIFIGMFVPMVTQIYYILGLGPENIDVTPFSYLVMGIFLTWGLYHYEILFFSRITHEMIFNTIEEAVIVIDKNGVILNFNEATKNCFTELKNLKSGKSIEDYKYLNNLLHNDFKSLNIEDHYYSVKVIPIDMNSGNIIVFTDITDITLSRKQLEKLAITDELTELYNRRFFTDYWSNEIRSKDVIMLLDIDKFKKVNDTFGHLTGDRVLKEFSQHFQSSFPDGILCRYGGEEFVCLFESGDIEKIYVRAEKFRESFANRQTEAPCTVSIGLTYTQGTYSDTMNFVDKLLYEAKHRGRNCTAVYKRNNHLL